MERKLKERVVGAALLVLLGVIVIPWLLDGRVAPAEATQTLELPRAGAGASTTRTIVLDGGQQAVKQTAEPPERPLADPATTRPPEPVPEAPPPAAAQRTPPERSDAAPAVEALDSEPPPAAPRPAVADPPPPRTVMTDPTAGWAVQVGSFSSQGNAQKLTKSLIELGYKAFVSRKVINERVMYRVRVGPQRSREEALALAERLKAENQPVRIVEHPG